MGAITIKGPISSKVEPLTKDHSVYVVFMYWFIKYTIYKIIYFGLDIDIETKYDP